MRRGNKARSQFGTIVEGCSADVVAADQVDVDVDDGFEAIEAEFTAGAKKLPAVPATTISKLLNRSDLAAIASFTAA
ncbi:hypothetical protein HNQ57_003327 [Zhongshania antarctica]|uniref:Uncharacterized protein n=1 Tax=Zhongshania antarctica TaxID=641702 RepID=A0A840R933_9GAMM|nr:hypothetical protein [Zhongshania antarctica]MBB5189028.1 hypothetical protein [Zhongshania antarctica]